MKNRSRLWLTGIVLTASAGLCAIATAQELSLGDFGDQPLIRVNGTGRVPVKADLALLNLGVETQARTAEEARAAAATAMTAVLGAVQAAGIEDKDVQTQNLSVNPVYAPNTANRVSGYQVQHQLTVKVRDIARVGSVIDAALQAGGDAARMHGLGFTVEDTTAAESEARAKAYANALAKAEDYAAAAGFKLARPVRVFDMPAFFPGPIPMGGVAMARMAEAAPTPIAVGEQEVMATVEVLFSVMDQPAP